MSLLVKYQAIFKASSLKHLSGLSPNMSFNHCFFRTEHKWIQKTNKYNSILSLHTHLTLKCLKLHVLQYINLIDSVFLYKAQIIFAIHYCFKYIWKEIIISKEYKKSEKTSKALMPKYFKYSMFLLLKMCL